MKKYFILAAAAAMMLSACSFDRDLDYGGAGTSYENAIPLTMGYTLGGMKASTAATRGNLIDLQDDAINPTDNTNKIGIFVLKKSGTTPTEKYERINAASTSLTKDDPASKYTLIGLTTSGQTLVYPDNKTQEIDIYAYAPYISSTTTTESHVPAATYGVLDASTGLFQGSTTDKITFFTETNQTDKAKYYLSDVLWGCAGTGTQVAATANTGGAYKLLEWETAPSSGTFLNSANVNEITAKKYLEIKNGDSNGDGTSDLTADGRSGAYFYTAPVTTPTAKNSAADVVVPLLHRGSKIIMNIKTSGMDYKKLQNAEVEFYVDYVSGELNISTGEFTPIVPSTAPTTGTPILLTTHLGIDAPGSSPTAEGEYKSDNTNVDGYSCSAVIIPQTITAANGGTSANAGKEPIIKIKLKADNTVGAIDNSTINPTAVYVYKTNDATPTTFASGKKYIYNITVKASGLTVTTTVQDWVDDSTNLPGTSPGVGEAELQ